MVTFFVIISAQLQILVLGWPFWRQLSNSGTWVVFLVTFVVAFHILVLGWAFREILAVGRMFWPSSRASREHRVATPR